MCKMQTLDFYYLVGDAEEDQNKKSWGLFIGKTKRGRLLLNLYSSYCAAFLVFKCYPSKLKINCGIKQFKIFNILS